MELVIGTDGYLNTAMNEPFTFTLCIHFDQHLATVDSDLTESTTSQTIEGRIIGVKKSTRILACVEECHSQSWWYFGTLPCLKLDTGAIRVSFPVDVTYCS